MNSFLQELVKIASFKITARPGKKEGSTRYTLRDGRRTAGTALIFHSSSEGDGPWLKGIHVKPSYRRKGVSKHLMDAIYSDYKGKTMRLRARPYKDKPLTKQQLMRFYRKRGFTPYDSDGRMYKKIG